MANEINMPSAFGGLTRYNEEYDSKIKLKPEYLIVFLALIVVFRIALSWFFHY